LKFFRIKLDNFDIKQCNLSSHMYVYTVKFLFLQCPTIVFVIQQTPCKSFIIIFTCHRQISRAWVASNVEGTFKRSATLGMVIGFGNINGAVAANIVSEFYLLP
jgi:hypothetical protein